MARREEARYKQRSGRGLSMKGDREENTIIMCPLPKKPRKIHIYRSREP